MDTHLPPQITEHMQRPQQMTFEIKVLSYDKHKKSGGTKQVNEIPTC